ncbi:hypothetical protein XENOCAPTIV_028653, partial [Xenoophorus captivus]
VEDMKPDPDSMLVIMASLDGSTAIETFLAAIHLERYLDTFHQAGLLLARDLSHLDHDALVSLGVTATGHRKRILRLVNHIQRRGAQRANQGADLLCDLSEGGSNATSLQHSAGPGSTFNLESRLMNLDGNRPAMKPVPKPRTVFNRRRTAPVQFNPTLDPAGPLPRRLSQESICFTVLEGLTTEASPGRAQISEATSTPAGCQRPRQVSRTRPSRSLSLSDTVGSVPPVPPRLNRSTGVYVTPPSSSSAERQLLSSPPGRPGSLDGTRLSGSSGSPRGGSMEMVSNEIYWGTSPSCTATGQIITRTSTIPHITTVLQIGSTLSNNSSGSARASTDDPEEEISPYCEAVFQTRRSPTASEGYSTVGEAPPPLRCSSLPPHSLLAEADDDLTISPYASYASLTERAPPIISSWLDKLSPQGCDVYPKGVIPLAAIQMARSAKDNKFEIVTSHRIFVFRTDNEVLRRRWVATLQEHVRDHRVFGLRRFGPGSHCQKHGVLELKGTKSKVYAAINTDQIWLYKSEQVSPLTEPPAMGEVLMIRQVSQQNFTLRLLSFTAESDREKRDWMEALQEAIAETLSDYEVAEKIWSNRSNRMCADCKALNPDWASINLCVVICKNCAESNCPSSPCAPQVLCSAVSEQTLLKTVTQIFSEAARFAGDSDDRQQQQHRLEHVSPSVYLMVSESPHISTTTIISSVIMTDVASPSNFQKFWCSVDQSLVLYESDHSADPCLRISLKDIVCLGVSRPDSSSNNNGFIDRLVFSFMVPPAGVCLKLTVLFCLFCRFRYTFELYVASEKLFMFGLETADALHIWTKAIGQVQTSLSAWFWFCMAAQKPEQTQFLFS